jgi:hypothetical protein
MGAFRETIDGKNDLAALSDYRKRSRRIERRGDRESGLQRETVRRGILEEAMQVADGHQSLHGSNQPSWNVSGCDMPSSPWQHRLQNLKCLPRLMYLPYAYLV